MISVGQIPEGFSTTDVYELHLAELPGALVGRRALYTELIWDAEGGFQQEWLDGSSVEGNPDEGYTFVLKRRAFSAAGLSLFTVGFASGGGGGDATSIQGIDVVATPPTDGQILEYDVGTNTIEWVDPPSGGGTLAGDVTGPSSTNTVGAIQGFDVDMTGAVDGQVLQLVGGVWKPVTPSGGSFTPALYSGHDDANGGFSSGTWTSIVTGGWVDMAQVNITRSGTNFTLANAGYYFLAADFTVYTTGIFYGYRVMVNGVMVATREVYIAAGTANTMGPSNLQIGFVATAGAVVTVEASASGGTGFAGLASLGSPAQNGMSIGNLTIVRVS